MQALKKNYQRIISLNLAKKIIISLVVILFFDFFLFSAPALASESNNPFNLSQNLGVANTIEDQQQIESTPEIQPIFINNLPDNPDLNVIRISSHVVTAYNSEAGQTDDSPCITANGFDVCKHGIEDTIAANFLSFGTKVKIPEIFGDKVFVVRDRMNQRHANRLDVWMVDRQDAKQFGVKLAKIQILE